MSLGDGRVGAEEDRRGRITACNATASIPDEGGCLLARWRAARCKERYRAAGVRAGGGWARPRRPSRGPGS